MLEVRGTVVEGILVKEDGVGGHVRDLQLHISPFLRIDDVYDTYAVLVLFCHKVHRRRWKAWEARLLGTHGQCQI